MQNCLSPPCLHILHCKEMLDFRECKPEASWNYTACLLLAGPAMYKQDHMLACCCCTGV